MELINFAKAIILGGGFVAALFHGPRIIRTLAVRYGFLIDIAVGVGLITVLAPAGAAATAFGGMLAMAITAILVVIRWKGRPGIESVWTNKDRWQSTLIVLAAGWLPWLIYPTWWLVWFALIVLVATMRPLTQPEIESLRKDPEILYMRKSTWKRFLKN